MPEENDVNYKIPGETGKCCSDCSEFKAHADDANKGECHGHEVVANGSCDYFNAK
jgi:hypothetical protein